MKRGTPLERRMKRQGAKLATEPKPTSGKTIALLFFGAVVFVVGLMTLFAWLGGRFG